MFQGLSHFFSMESQADKFMFPLKSTKTAGLNFLKHTHTQETNQQQ